MATSPDLGVPLLSSGQAQPDVTFNEAMILLQVMLYGVISLGTNTPPGSPTEGDSYVIGTAPTGAWAGKANKIAVYYGGSWRFVPGNNSSGSDIPMSARHEGLRVWVKDVNALYVFSQNAASPENNQWFSLVTLSA